MSPAHTGTTPASAAGRGPYLVSRAYDLGWFAAPGLIAVLLSLWLVKRGPARESDELVFWLVSVVAIDVAHVYASLYRTYLDPEARRLHGKRLWIVPALCAWFGLLAHLASPAVFWTLLAYLAVFHFIKQHEGFAGLYLKAEGASASDRRATRAAIWAVTLGPVLHWHAHLPRNFAWFVEGDFLRGLSPQLGSAALWLQLPVLAWWLLRRGQAAARGRVNPMLWWMVLLPALTWNMGMVWFNDDRVFTLTNVMLHGVPYLALVWVTGGRQSAERIAGASSTPRPLLWVVAVYYGLLLVLAFSEEALWDRLVWHDHPQLFGSTTALEGPESLTMALVVALLTVPQATHYILDRHIWRPGPTNPQLARQLGFDRR